MLGLGIEDAEGFLNEAVIGAGTLNETQALAGVIGSTQGITNRLTILGGDQRVGCAENI